MEIENAPQNAIRITFEFFTIGSYTEKEKGNLLESLKEEALAFDDDFVPNSESIKFEKESEIIEAKRVELAKLLDSAIIETSVSLQFGGNAGDLMVEVSSEKSE